MISDAVFSVIECHCLRRSCHLAFDQGAVKSNRPLSSVMCVTKQLALCSASEFFTIRFDSIGGDRRNEDYNPLQLKELSPLWRGFNEFGRLNAVFYPF
jgi:hypothetical protein